MLPKGHRRHIDQGVSRAWVLYGVVLFGVVLEVAMGLYVHLQLGQRSSPWSSGTLIWTVVLSLLALVEGAVGLLVHRWLLGPASLLRRLRKSLEQEESGLVPGLQNGAPIPLELLTVLATRAVFFADVVAWILLQFITIYGLILVVITGQLWILMTFAVASLLLLTRVAPSRARIARLIDGLLKERE